MPSRRDAAADPIETAPLSPSLRVLARQGVLKHVRKGTEIITEGDIGDSIYIVLAGRLRTYSVGGAGQEITYGSYGPGEYVGEMGFDGGPRSANVQAVEPSTCVLVTRATLERHLAADPAFAFELLAKVIRLARTATMSLRLIALNAVYGRVKVQLESLAVPQADKTALIDPMPTHKEIAQRLGCGREMVTRVMNDLKAGGYVQACPPHALQLLKKLPAKW